MYDIDSNRITNINGDYYFLRETKTKRTKCKQGKIKIKGKTCFLTKARVIGRKTVYYYGDHGLADYNTMSSAIRRSAPRGTRKYLIISSTSASFNSKQDSVTVVFFR